MSKLVAHPPYTCAYCGTEVVADEHPRLIEQCECPACWAKGTANMFREAAARARAYNDTLNPKDAP